jgi:hypothetical protein
MSVANDSDFEKLANVKVPIARLKQPIPVLTPWDAQTSPKGKLILAPDTRHVEVFVAFERGYNYYGSLDEDLFVCRDGDDDADWTVLWVTFNADQAQDDVPRLRPFCMLAVGWEPDDLDDEMTALIGGFDALELEGLILLWAYANRIATAYGDYLARAEVKGGLITGEVAKLVVEAGVSGKPLDLSEFSQRH